jgi:hypothetical protein
VRSDSVWWRKEEEEGRREGRIAGAEELGVPGVCTYNEVPV